MVVVPGVGGVVITPVGIETVAVGGAVKPVNIPVGIETVAVEELP